MTGPNPLPSGHCASIDRGTMFAIKELFGSKLKFSLIALAIGLVVSLTMVTSAMSEGLLTGMSGAKSRLDADALVFQRDTYPTIERSILSADDLDAIAQAAGIAEVYGMGHTYASVGSVDEPFDVRVFGLGGRMDQLPILEGRVASEPGEAVLDATAELDGIGIGDEITLTPMDATLTVVGFTEGRRYVMVPTIWVDLKTWEELHLATLLGVGDDGEKADEMTAERMEEQFAGSASVAAIDFEPGAGVEDVQRELGDAFRVAGIQDAADAGNGMPEMILAVNGIQGVSVVIGALLVGVFFYITTLHKTSQIAAIKAIGASNAYLYRDLILQITMLVAVATVVGTLLALGAGVGMPPMMAFDPDPRRWAVAVLAIFGTAYIGSLFSLRSILKIDPATALGRTSA
ncbi:MAG: ABC transporter permease [Coriobacteriia bacterium]|nr:ABC transporter permease [Coriobacteriia bacterium]